MLWDDFVKLQFLKTESINTLDINRFTDRILLVTVFYKHLIHERRREG